MWRHDAGHPRDTLLFEEEDPRCVAPSVPPRPFVQWNPLFQTSWDPKNCSDKRTVLILGVNIRRERVFGTFMNTRYPQWIGIEGLHCTIWNNSPCKGMLDVVKQVR